MADTADRATWHRITAYNAQALYGYGTAADAAAYCDAINAGREINLYAAAALTDDEAIALRLEGGAAGNEGFDLADELAARAAAT